MKILTNKQYNKLLREITIPWSNVTYKQKCERLEVELKEVKDLSKILEKMSSLTINGQGFASSDGHWGTMELPEEYLRYVDDILGGKVIKQEGNKCIVIDKDGNVKTGLTKQKVDKKYSYKLIRE